MRKTALFMALVLALESIVPGSVLAAEQTPEPVEEIVADGTTEGEDEATILETDPNAPTVTYLGWARPEGTYGMDQTGKYVSFWVYGKNLTRDIVPVVYQGANYEDKEGVAATTGLAGFELLENGKGAVYKLVKGSNFSDTNNYNYVRFADVEDAKNTWVHCVAYDIGDGRVEGATTMSVEAHYDCGLEYVRTYVCESFAPEGATVKVLPIYYENVWDAVQLKEVSVKIEKDENGRLYAELNEDYADYSKIQDVVAHNGYVKVTNSNNKYGMVKFADNPCEHMDNLSVPEGYSWQVMKINDVGASFFEGTNTGDAVLTAEQISKISGIGNVRVNLIKDGVIEQQFSAAIGSGKPSTLSKLKKAIKDGTAPKIALVSGSTTTLGAKVKVTNPECVTKYYDEGLRYVVTIIDANNDRATRHIAVSNLAAEEIEAYVGRMDGGTYKVSVALGYYDADMDMVTNTGKSSNVVTVTLVNPYEKTLTVASKAAKLKQGNDDITTLATITWNNADEQYRKINQDKIEITAGPKGATNLKELSRALYYDAADSSIKINIKSHSGGWNGVYAGQYTVKISAPQAAGKTPASKTFTFTVLPTAKSLAGGFNSTWFYKEQGKELVLKPTVLFTDYADQPIAAKDAPKDVKFTLLDAYETYGTPLDAKYATVDANGVVTVNKDFNGENQEFAFWLKVEWTEDGKTSSESFESTRVYTTNPGISGFKLDGEELAPNEKHEVSVKAYEINGRRLWAEDASPWGEYLFSYCATYTVKGSSLKLDAYNNIVTTGKPGKTTVTVTYKDGSKVSDYIVFNVELDAVSLDFQQDGKTISLKENEENVIELEPNQPLMFYVNGSNHEIANDTTNAVKYKVSAKTGKLLDVRKAVNGYKYASGVLSYVPKAEEDVITFTDNSVKPAKTVQYKIRIPAMSKQNQAAVKVKSNKAKIYTNMYSGEIKFELLSDTNFSGGVVSLTADPAKLNKKDYDKYSKLEHLVLNGHIDSNNAAVFDISSYTDLPAGTYSMFLQVKKGDVVSAPIPVKITVAKLPKVTVRATAKNIAGTKNAKVEIKGTNTLTVTAQNYANAPVGKTGELNHFKDYFEMYPGDDGLYVRFKGSDIKLVPANDRTCLVKCTVYDLGGYSMDIDVPVKVTIK